VNRQDATAAAKTARSQFQGQLVEITPAAVASLTMTVF
jgi:hypothetical protein